MDKMTIDQMASFCKKKGFVFQNSEIYGGMAGFFDYGPLGCELKQNIKNLWWKKFVHERDDIAPIDGAIITHPKVWKASGHVDGFGDILVTCTNADCQETLRGDHLVADALGIQADGMSTGQIDELIKKNDLVCPKCKSAFGLAKTFNLMFTTQVGAKQTSASTAYLRPETAQVIFANFRLVQEMSRMKLPFGIIQIGKAFRNEISPRNFLFRCREFEQIEIEFFIDPNKVEKCPYYGEIKDYKLNVWTSDMQAKESAHENMPIKRLIDEGTIKSEWHAYWLVKVLDWFVQAGVKADNLRLREHLKDELAHYACACFDVEYNFPFGWQEIHGMADRSTFDLTQHIKFSKKDLSVYDEETKQKIVPHVIEPSQGLDRAFLSILFDAYDDDKDRGNIVLKLDSRLAPVKVGVFPLVNKLNEKAWEIYKDLKMDIVSIFDKSGSIGRRYARADEMGVPYCVTYDFDTLEDQSVTIRDRDSTAQRRVKLKDLKKTLQELLDGESFQNVGQAVETK